ncbi:hypothetical protein MUGA111182_16940 [Mucilaginibacter galii]|uniref:DUF4403 family protein n=1 Tax=Mucilaginibacter galii TaxID=2005073 RepID=A0A917J9E4_9SPHI|nr:hypothetical protein [Mucilaginibacter galii]GGI49709.1 hypothetical protein GCM10011425_09210 [Mucilaginibacter galii]
MKKNLAIFTGVVLLALFYSCKTLEQQVNQFKPVSTTSQQYLAIEKNLAQLDSMSPHVGAHIDKSFLMEYLPAEIKKNAESINDENLIITKLDPTVELDQQGVFIRGDFNITLVKYDITIAGEFKGVAATSLEGDSLFLRTALNWLDIQNIKYIKKPGLTKKALVAIIVPALRNFMTTANALFLRKPFAFYVPLKQVYQFDVTRLFKDTALRISATPVELARYNKKSAVKIGSEGITTLIELTNKQPNTPPAPPAGIASYSPKQLKEKFNEYTKKFEQHWLNNLDTLPKGAAVVAMVRKSELAGLVNQALSNPVTVSRNLLLPPMQVNEKVELEKSKINCQAVRTDFSYPAFNGDACDWNCMRRITIGVCPFCRRVRVEDPACAASRRACVIKREAERVIWQTARNAANLAHEAENIAKIGACNIWRSATDFVALGRFKVDAGGSGNGSVNFSSIHLNDDLSKISLQYNGNVNVNFKADLEMTPLDLGHIFLCFARYSKTIRTSIAASIPASSSTLNITPVTQGNNLLLNVQVDPVSYRATMNNGPLEQLFSDVTFRAQCPIFSTLMQAGTIGATVGNFLGVVKLAPEQKLLLTGSASGQYEIKELSIPVKPIVFRINQGEDKQSVISWRTKTIQFAYTKPLLMAGN